MTPSSACWPEPTGWWKSIPACELTQACRGPSDARLAPNSRWCKKPMSACTAENVTQQQHALDEIYRQHSQSVHHDYQASFHLLDVDMSGLPCGPKAAFAT